MAKKNSGIHPVTKSLQDITELFKERNNAYNTESGIDAYKMHGDVMLSFFPEGITLNTSEDFGRMAIFDMLAGKMLRYANNFSYGGHSDSLNDISVYAQMLNDLDKQNENSDI